MSEHYYSQKPDSISQQQLITVNLLGNILKFYTDNGVFSKNNIDFGSQELISQIKIKSWMTQVIDVGCGYGVLSIALLMKYPQLQAKMLDVNTRALALAQKNCQLNGCLSRVQILENNVLQGIERHSADIIISNPPIRAGKQVVHSILTSAYDVLVDNGELWIVIQKKQGMASAKKIMQQSFGHVEVIAKNKGYYILMSKKIIK